MYKIAIAGASTLVGRELKDALSDSPLGASSFTLLDEDEVQGQLDQVGDEITFVQAIGPDAFDRIDFTFFCGMEDLTRKHWRDALRAGSTVLDLSGALDQEAGVLVRAPWLGSEAETADLFTHVCHLLVQFMLPHPHRASRASSSAGEGAEIEKLKTELGKRTNRDVFIDIIEVNKPELDAQLVSENIALQLEKRVSFRRAMRKSVDSALRFGCKGIKVRVSGRSERQRNRALGVVFAGAFAAAHAARRYRLRLTKPTRPMA